MPREMTSLPRDAVLLASYWGKADPEMALNGPDHHTVLGHSLDVAACAFVLVDHNRGLQRQFASATGIPANAVALTLAAVCGLHDVGKIDTRFQRKAAVVADVLRPHTVGIARESYDHGTEGFRQIEADGPALARLVTGLGGSALPLLRAVCGHHGALPSRDEPDPSRSKLPRAVRAEDVKARALFQDLILKFFADEGAVLPWITPVAGPVVQRLAGLCAVADWVGSDVSHFPYATGPVDDVTAYWNRACGRAAEACAGAGLMRATSVAADFETLFPGYVPRDVQTLTEAVATETPALVIVEAEMGKGKTEAALSIASRFLANGIGEGLTVTLPTMATSNAMFARVEDVVTRIFPTGDVQFALAHGRSLRSDRFQTLIQRSLRARDPDATEASVMCARWLIQRKRILLAQVGVGTIDQALQAGLVLRHQFVRMFGLSRNVVIVDEVHAYDAYMEVLLEHLLGWLGAMDVPVVLLSATLPSTRRAALSRAWLGTTDGVSGDTAEDDLPSAAARPYPLVSVTTRGGAMTLSSDEPRPSRAVILENATVTSEDDAHHVEGVAARLLAAAKAGARVVWIRNTVGEAQRAFGAVRASAGTTEHALFHARFRGRDRSVIEGRVLERFGKSAPPGGRVLVATQVVEQSLDLDFDEMHTDLAPIDLIFQRAGRLHRHDRARPPGFERPRLVVHGPSRDHLAALRFGPSRFVYDAGTLWITQRALLTREHFMLPDDIRPLVEETYHRASRESLIPLGGPALIAAESKLASLLDARRTKARQCCIPPTSAEPSGQIALPDDEDAVQAFTRDGKSATLLPFSWGEDGARSLDAVDGTPVWALDAGLNDAWRLAGELPAPRPGLNACIGAAK
jgi:CRISPR-associated endonuclease/helicase Cas3